MSLLLNWAAMLAARLLPPAFGFAINVGIARAWGAAGLGSYVYLTSLLLVFQAVAGAGMSLLLVREIAARPEEAAALAARGRTIGLVSGAFATVAFIAFAAATASGDVAAGACVLALSLLPTAWITVQESCFVAQHRHHFVAVTAAVENAVKLALAAAAFLLGGGLVALCGAIAAARFATLLAGHRLLVRSGLGGLAVERRGAWALARSLPAFAGMLVLAILYFRIDVLVLQALRPESETGLYAAALTLYGIAFLVPESALAAVYPRLARSFRAERSDFGPGTWLAARLLAVGIVPVSVTLIALARPILELVYGAAFAGAAGALALLAAALPLHALNGAFGQALQASGEQRAALRAALAVTALHVVVTVVLVRFVGALGAPIAVLFSASVAALATGVLVHRRAAPLPAAGGLVRTAVAVVLPIALALGLAPDHAWTGGALALAALGAALVAERLRDGSDLAQAWLRLRPARTEAGT